MLGPGVSLGDSFLQGCEFDLLDFLGVIVDADPVAGRRSETKVRAGNLVAAVLPFHAVCLEDRGSGGVFPRPEQGMKLDFPRITESVPAYSSGLSVENVGLTASPAPPDSMASLLHQTGVDQFLSEFRGKFVVVAPAVHSAARPAVVGFAVDGRGVLPVFHHKEIPCVLTSPIGQILQREHLISDRPARSILTFVAHASLPSDSRSPRTIEYLV